VPAPVWSKKNLGPVATLPKGQRRLEPPLVRGLAMHSIGWVGPGVGLARPAELHREGCQVVINGPTATQQFPARRGGTVCARPVKKASTLRGLITKYPPGEGATLPVSRAMPQLRTAPSATCLNGGGALGARPLQAGWVEYREAQDPPWPMREGGNPKWFVALRAAFAKWTQKAPVSHTRTKL